MTGLLQINLEKKVIKITLGPEGLESDRKDFFVVLSVFCMLTLFACCRLASSTWWGIQLLVALGLHLLSFIIREFQ